MMTAKPLVEVALRLTGQGFSPGDVTAMIQLAPTKTWRAGDSVQGTLLKRKNDAWVFGLPQRETYDLDAVVRELLNAIEPYAEKLAEAATHFSLEKEISFGIYINAETPSGWFAADTLRRLASLGAHLDLDLILCKR